MPDPLAPAPRSLTWRSLGLGLLLTLTIVTVGPYNDLVVGNSPMVGSFFPPVVALAMLAVVLLVNGPLHKFAPRLAMRPGELAVVLAIALIACSVPYQGLMRQMLPVPVAPFYYTGQDPKYLQLFKDMHLPAWLFAVKSPETGASERAVTAFYARLQPGEAVPWGSWLKPLAGWGVFVAAVMTTLLSLACLLRYQWAVNERLAFPIAQLESMLVAPPRPGRALNDVFASRLFWIGLGLVLVIESSAVLSLYYPKYVPAIPFGYDLSPTFSDAPWATLPPWLKTGRLYFTLLGLSYFTTTRVSFSLWFTALLVAVLRWAFDPAGAVASDAAMNDQALGASAAFVFGVLWVGRGHWAVIWRSLIGRRRPGDAQGVFVTYRKAAIAFLAGVAAMFGWLCVVGCTPWLAAAVVTMILCAHLVTARVVAETGLAFLRVGVTFDTVLKALPARLISPRDAFVYGVSHYGFMQAGRESELTFALHGLNVIDAAGGNGRPRDRRTVPVLGGTLAVATLACVAVSLWCYYTHAAPLADDGAGVLNAYGTLIWPKTFLVDFPTAVAAGAHAPKAYSVWTQLTAGVGVTVVLQALTWRFAAWPLLPVGYLLCGNWFLTSAWLSLVLGWTLKTLVLRVGGAKLFNDLKPLFIGLIFGEALATGLWQTVTLLLALSGREFHVVRFLPT